MELDIEHFKNLLLEEKDRLKKQLASHGRQINESGDWIATPTKDADGFFADKNENADAVEDFEASIATVSALEQEYSLVMRALAKIEKNDGTFGKDEMDGSDIEIERLEANPAARTSIANMDREGALD